MEKGKRMLSFAGDITVFTVPAASLCALVCTLPPVEQTPRGPSLHHPPSPPLLSSPALKICHGYSLLIPGLVSMHITASYTPRVTVLRHRAHDACCSMGRHCHRRDGRGEVRDAEAIHLHAPQKAFYLEG